MTRFGFYWFTALLLVTLPTRSAETNGTPDFKEVYDLVRAHLAGATDAELNRAAIEGLLESLRGKVALVGGQAGPTRTNAPLVSKSTVLDSKVAYIRVGRVDSGLAKAFDAAFQKLGGTNQLEGVVLDLRFAYGEDYAAVAAVADLFLGQARPLLDWGNGMVKSGLNANAIKVPVAVTINHETRGAAEALAAVLREAGVGLILGSTSAGQAMISQEFDLKDGERLRIATSPVKLGDGTLLTGAGVKPDIAVAVTAEDERTYFENAYAQITKTNLLGGTELSEIGAPEETNRPSRRPRPTEADLVRARREGTNLDADSQFVRDSEPQKPLIRDPALARAVDLLKGLAVVRRSRS